MALELCYTSSPQGLLPGAHGYCTVAASAGLTGPMVQRLETLSGYRPMFGIGDARASSNPVAFSHLRMAFGGESRSVLSRVAYAGADYSGRINKFAHHLLLEHDERIAAGPAWLLNQDGLMRDEWPEPPRRIAQPREIPQGDSPPAICQLWQDTTGDAGWAGVLAEYHLLDPAKPTYVIYDAARHDALGMIGEAMAMLPLSRRWEVSFSTYFTDPPADAECGWRWVASETPMAERIRAGEIPGRVIDLLGTLLRAADSRYVRGAREGGMPDSPQPALPAGTDTPKTPPDIQPAAAAAQPEAPAFSNVIAEDASPSAVHLNTAVKTPAIAPHRIPAPVGNGPGLGRLVAAAAIGAITVLAGVYLLRTPAPAAANRPDAAESDEWATSEKDLADSRAYAASLERQIATLNGRLIEQEQLAARPSPLDPSAHSQAGTADTPPDGRVDTAPLEDGAAADPENASPDRPPTATSPALIDDGEAPAFVSKRLYVETRAPRFEEQSASGIGVLSRLVADEQLLWSADSSSLAVALRVASPIAESDATLQWISDSDGVSVVHTTFDSLGIARRQILGVGRLEPRGLVWRWQSAPFHPGGTESGDVLAELHDLLKYAVLSVEDRAGRTLAEVQPSTPKQIKTPAGAALAVLIPDAVGFTPTLAVDDAPASWRFIPAGDQQPGILQGHRGADLQITLSAATGKFITQWSPNAEPKTLVQRLARVQLRHGKLSDLLEQHQAFEESLIHTRARLPRKNNSDEIDQALRDQPRWREAFVAYDRARDERGEFLAEYAPEGIEPLSQEHANLSKQIVTDMELNKDLASFTQATLRVLAGHSGADIAVIKLYREAS